jgi:hypothetical protein
MNFFNSWLVHFIYFGWLWRAKLGLRLRSSSYWGKTPMHARIVCHSLFPYFSPLSSFIFGPRSSSFPHFLYSIFSATWEKCVPFLGPYSTARIRMPKWKRKKQ